MADYDCIARARAAVQYTWCNTNPADPRACCRVNTDAVASTPTPARELWLAIHARNHAMLSARTTTPGPGTAFLLLDPFAPSFTRAPSDLVHDLLWRDPVGRPPPPVRVRPAR